MMSLTHWKTWCSLLAVFAAGCVVGSVVTVRAVKRIVAEHKNTENWTPRTMKWIDDNTQLSAEQKTKIEPTVARSVTDLKKLRDDAELSVKQILGAMLLEISAELDEGQRTRLQTAIKKQQAIDRGA